MKGLLKSSIRDNNPVIILYKSESLTKRGSANDPEYVIPLGVGEIKKKVLM